MREHLTKHVSPKVPGVPNLREGHWEKYIKNSPFFSCTKLKLLPYQENELSQCTKKGLGCEFPEISYAYFFTSWPQNDGGILAFWLMQAPFPIDDLNKKSPINITL